jgi:hypothetical protein
LLEDNTVIANLRTVTRHEWLPDQLYPVAYRVARADECAFEIAKLAGRWSFDGPLGLVQYVWQNRYSVRVDSVRPIPPRISLLFSEAVGHLRAALDNVVWFIVEQAQGPLSLPSSGLPSRFWQA